MTQVEMTHIMNVLIKYALTTCHFHIEETLPTKKKKKKKWNHFSRWWTDVMNSSAAWPQRKLLHLLHSQSSLIARLMPVLTPPSACAIPQPLLSFLACNPVSDTVVLLCGGAEEGGCSGRNKVAVIGPLTGKTSEVTPPPPPHTSLW